MKRIKGQQSQIDIAVDVYRLIDDISYLSDFIKSTIPHDTSVYTIMSPTTVTKLRRLLRNSEFHLTNTSTLIVDSLNPDIP
jgi:hypothetical protein